MTKKAKKKSGVLYRIILAVLILIIAFCLYKIGTILYEYYEGTKEYNSVQQLAGVQADSFTGEVDFDALVKKTRMSKLGFIRKIRLSIILSYRERTTSIICIV
ncbi:MAG: hypothetical protein ACLVC2_04760 [Emergencia timonensis]